MDYSYKLDFLKIRLDGTIRWLLFSGLSMFLLFLSFIAEEQQLQVVSNTWFVLGQPLLFVLMTMGLIGAFYSRCYSDQPLTKTKTQVEEEYEILNLKREISRKQKLQKLQIKK